VFVIIIKFYYGFNESIVIFFLLALAESINNTAYSFYVFVMGIGKSAFLIFQQTMNVIFVSVFLIAGLTIFKNSFGFLGYYFSVLIGNTILLGYIKRKSGLEIIKFLKDVKIYKIALFHTLIIINVIIINAAFEKLFYAEIVFCLLVLFLFLSDLKKFFEFGKQIISSKFKLT
jgi:hypothetical protein